MWSAVAVSGLLSLALAAATAEVLGQSSGKLSPGSGQHVRCKTG